MTPKRSWVQKERHSIFWDAATIVVAAVMVNFAASWLGSTPLVEDVAHAGYKHLQRSLATDPERERVPFTIVDISRIEPTVPTAAPDHPGVTPRKTLWSLVSAIAKYEPRVIAVDIDFAPDLDRDQDSLRWQDPGLDPWFFGRCRDLAEGKIPSLPRVPVFLGVRRSLAGPARTWLGLDEYRSLAAGIAIPDDNRMLYLLTEAESPVTRGHFEPCSTLGVRAAASVGAQLRPPKRWIQWAVESIDSVPARNSRDSSSEEFRVIQFFADYGSLPTMKNRVVRAATADQIDPPAAFRNHAVFLGDIDRADETGDLHPSPIARAGQGDRVPGVYLHVAAYQTAMHGALYKLSSRGHLALDALMTLALILVMSVTRWHYLTQERRLVRKEAISAAFAAFKILLFIALGLVFVRWTRFLWDGFVLVLPILVLSKWIKIGVHRVAGGDIAEARKRLEGWLLLKKGVHERS